jgi:hypothetical protein
MQGKRQQGAMKEEQRGSPKCGRKPKKMQGGEKKISNS